MDRDFISNLLGSSPAELKAFVYTSVNVLYYLVTLLWNFTFVYILDKFVPSNYNGFKWIEIALVEIVFVVTVSKLVEYSNKLILRRLYRSSYKYYETKLSA